MVSEPVLCLYKKEEEATKVGAYQHQEATYLKDIQCQGDMGVYTGTPSDLYANLVDIFLINDHINNQNKLI